ncbi:MULTISPECIES: sulfite exporter TauE/SafE family protein [Brevibacillus]|nr:MULTISPECIES: sulfite exporter TauE/SafE family protein [Brevibacillus]
MVLTPSIQAPLSLTKKMNQFAGRFDGGTQSFLMGFTFSLGFCPTMFWVFFGLAVPLMLSSSIGIFVPIIFAIGTAIPLFVVLLILSFVGDRARMMNKTKRIGTGIQKLAGTIIIFLGISDFLIFW